jgi:hypothetical protein
VVLAAGATRVGAAQRVRLRVTAGSPIAFPVVTEAHYDGGSVPASAALAFTMNLSGGGAGALRTSILSIRATAALMGGSSNRARSGGTRR